MEVELSTTALVALVLVVAASVLVALTATIPAAWAYRQAKQAHAQQVQLNAAAPTANMSGFQAFNVRYLRAAVAASLVTAALDPQDSIAKVSHAVTTAVTAITLNYTLT